MARRAATPRATSARRPPARIVVAGAGGLAREVRWLISEVAAAGAPLAFRGFVVSDLSRLGPYDSRDALLGDLGWIDEHPDEVDAAVIGIGAPAARLRVAAELERRFPRLEWPPLIHPSLRFDRAGGSVGRGAVLFHGVSVSVGVKIGAHALVYYGCTIGHETEMARASALYPGVNLAGGVILGEGALVGSGAQVIQYRRVGAGATVGAGAVVIRDVPPGITVVGVPARPVCRHDGESK